MPLQIGAAPDHDFDEPLGLLSDSHRRIEHFLDILIETERHAAVRTPDVAATWRSGSVPKILRGCGSQTHG
jgi:hypothetical protein